MAERMVVIQGDITRQAVGAIVNAVNERRRWQGTIPAGAG
jgi:O-acetyl-ADP-ribose deacetylase (regulator of RNase III)